MGFAGISEAHYLYQVLNHVNLSNYFLITVSFQYLYVAIPQYHGTKMGRVVFSYHANKYVYLGKKEENKWWAMRDLNPRPLPCEGSALPLSQSPP